MNRTALRKGAAAAIMSTVALGGAATALAPSANAATARNGVCETGEFCYYYNSNFAGSVSDFTASLGNYGATQPSCYEFKGTGAGQGTCIKNNAASVWNRSSVPVTVYYNSNYGGPSQVIPAGAKVNLNATLKNNNASHLFGSNGGSTGGPSSVGGAISRSEVLSRAQNWINRGIWYSESNYATDIQGKSYRTDCSGFVSMAWHLQNSEVTWTLPNFATKLSSYDQLQPGDMIDHTSTHVVLFVRWADSAHTSAVIDEEAHTGTKARQITYSRSYLSSNGFVPYRYNHITG